MTHYDTDIIAYNSVIIATWFADDNMQNIDSALLFCILFCILVHIYVKKYADAIFNMQNMQKNMQPLISICKIVHCLYCAYFAYTCTAQFADDSGSGAISKLGSASGIRAIPLYEIRVFRTYMYVLVCTQYVLVWNGIYMMYWYINRMMYWKYIT